MPPSRRLQEGQPRPVGGAGRREGQLQREADGAAFGDGGGEHQRVGEGQGQAE